MNSLEEINYYIEYCKNAQEATDDMELFLYYEDFLQELDLKRANIWSQIFQNT